jgi:hypothetical protein
VTAEVEKAQMFMSTFSSGRSRVDLARWAIELMNRWGLTHEYGFHVLDWSHDEQCPLNPSPGTVQLSSSRCLCQPNGMLVLHIGTADQRRIEVVRDGVALPVRPQPQTATPG